MINTIASTPKQMKFSGSRQVHCTEAKGSSPNGTGNVGLHLYYTGQVTEGRRTTFSISHLQIQTYSRDNLTAPATLHTYCKTKHNEKTTVNVTQTCPLMFGANISVLNANLHSWLSVMKLQTAITLFIRSLRQLLQKRCLLSMVGNVVDPSLRGRG